MQVIIVQVRQADVAKISDMLGSIKQSDYFFAILPLDAKLLSIEQVRQLLTELK